MTKGIEDTNDNKRHKTKKNSNTILLQRRTITGTEQNIIKNNLQKLEHQEQNENKQFKTILENS